MQMWMARGLVACACCQQWLTGVWHCDIMDCLKTWFAPTPYLSGGMQAQRQAHTRQVCRELPQAGNHPHRGDLQWGSATR